MAGPGSHLDPVEISAFADREGDVFTIRKWSDHVAGCERCAADVARCGRLDAAVAAVPVVTCASGLELRSALLDGELSPEEADVAQAHVAGCGACGRDASYWSSVDHAVQDLPAGVPPHQLDERIAALTAPAPRGRLAPPYGRVVLSATTAVALALAVAGAIPAPDRAPADRVALPPQTAYVAAVQQTALFRPTNTLYVVQPDASAVDAMDASTYALRVRISVGGRPTALALNEAANVIVVLDAQQRSLIQIDAHRNAVVGSTPLGDVGQPTSLQVDQSSGKVVVAAIPDPPSAAAPTPTLGTGDGLVIVVDTAKKTLETVRTVDVAPRLVVADPAGKQMLLVSPSRTTLVDQAYRTLRTLPGGIAAAFGSSGQVIVLAQDGTGGVVHMDRGDAGASSRRLAGVPLAVAHVPDVGFALLLSDGSARERRVEIIDASGAKVSTHVVAATSRDLNFDPAARKLFVVGGGDVAAVDVPGPAVAVEIPAETSPPRSAAPTPVRSEAPASSPAVTGPAAAQPSSPALAAQPATPVTLLGVPKAAVKTGPGTYELALPGQRALRAWSSRAGRVWFIDDRLQLGAIDLRTGTTFVFTTLPADSEPTAVDVNGAFVCIGDAGKGRVFTFAIHSERLATHLTPLRDISSVSLAPSGACAAAEHSSGRVALAYPLSRRVELLDVGLSGVADMTRDDTGRLWLADGARTLASYDETTGKVTQLRMPLAGGARVLLADPSGAIWVGTDRGEIVWVRGASVFTTATGVARPIMDLALDAAGRVWFLAPSASGDGLRLGPADGTAPSRIVRGPVSGWVDRLGDATWLSLLTGGLLIVTGEAE